MNRLIQINKHDYYRVVLTEVQPYELPFILTNEGFYNYISKYKDNADSFFAALFSQHKDTKPYDFNIVKTNDSLRRLSLVHPYSQYRFCDFYRQYNELITFRCSSSEFSLRYPVKIAQSYSSSTSEETVSKVRDEGVDIEEDIDGSTPIYASSFFTYNKYNFLYKFYDSYEFHRIERKFSKLHKFDISKCFENLSADMIPIAISGEDAYKDTTNTESFEEVFSELIISLNYNRTHGIVVGPEFSRIYAEIILQRIDNNIKNKLKADGLNNKVEYEIKRYVDDYFVFYNDQFHIAKIKSVAIEELAKFKLFTNESKDEYSERPFLTGVTQSKMEIRQFFDDLKRPIEINTVNKTLTIDNNFTFYSRISNSYITKIKSIVKRNNISYESISGYFLTLLRMLALDIGNISKDNCFDTITSSRLSKYILILVEISYFLYSMDSRVRSTFLLSEAIIQFSKISKTFDHDNELLINDKIMSESKFVLRHLPIRADKVETLNLAISLNELNCNMKITENDLLVLLGSKDNNTDLNYFQIIVGLYFIKDDTRYSILKNSLCDIAKLKIINCSNVFRDSECTHIVFDIMSCPYLTSQFKRTVLQIAYTNSGPLTVSFEELYTTLTENTWFVDWTELSINRLLKKKELRSAY